MFAEYTTIGNCPTILKLMSLLEPTEKNGNLHINSIFDPTQQWCWSCNELSSPSESAWVVGFSTATYYQLYLRNSGDVRAVRSYNTFLRIVTGITSPKVSLRGVFDEAISRHGPGIARTACPTPKPRNDICSQMGKLFRLRSLEGLFEYCRYFTTDSTHNRTEIFRRYV